MKIELLTKNPNFIPTIANWYYREWGSSAYVHTEDKEIVKLGCYLNENKVPLILTAIENEELVGVAQLKEHEMEIYPSFKYWLGGVYVAEKSRNKGIAKKLILEAIKKAKALKISKLYLQTEVLEGGLYKKLGWMKIEEVKYKNVDVAVMAINIEEPSD